MASQATRASVGLGREGGGEFVLATRNDHKLKEFERLLPGVQLLLLPIEVELPPEDGDSYAANALIKARAAAVATGRFVIADDSGIEAEELEGAPGILSARFSGPAATDGENLTKLRDLVDPGSKLRYVCALALVSPNGDERVFQGVCTGKASPELKGDRGFGYDPLFIPDQEDQGRTMAELTDLEKDAISHRGNAARAFLEWLQSK